MNCQSFQRELKGYLKGKRPGEENEAFKLHLEACPECKEKAEFFKGEGRIFLLSEAPAVPARLKKEVLAETLHRQGRLGSDSLSLSRALAYVLAASLTVAALFFFVLIRPRLSVVPVAAPKLVSGSEPRGLYIVQLVDNQNRLLTQRSFENEEEARSFLQGVTRLTTSRLKEEYPIRDVSYVYRAREAY